MKGGDAKVVTLLVTSCLMGLFMTVGLGKGLHIPYN